MVVDVQLIFIMWLSLVAHAGPSVHYHPYGASPLCLGTFARRATALRLQRHVVKEPADHVKRTLRLVPRHHVPRTPDCGKH